MRNILSFNPDQSTVTSPILPVVNGQWAVHTVNHPREALALSEKHRILVGVVHFPGQIDQSLLHKIENMINVQKQIKWFAVMDKLIFSNPSVIRIIADGFYDYFTLPIDEDRFSFALGHAWGMAEIGMVEMRKEDRPKEQDLEMVGTSPIMRNLFGLIRRFAQVDIPVLVTGETGTGKELVSRAMHDHSHRAKFPFVAVNCGALPGSLIQTELFGHEKGSFTGAHQQRIGRIEMASGGTIFLDEIGDLPLELQTNFLRFLQEKTYERVGGTKSLTADVRVIAATNVDLAKLVREGRFREDLFYRLNVLRVNLPPLRERGQDIEVLAKYFLEKFSKERKNSQVVGLSQQAVKCILEHNWPGNIRELINRVRRALVMCETRLIMPVDLELEEKTSPELPVDLRSARAANEKDQIVDVLEKTKFNISKGAALLGISRVTLYRLIQKYGIEVDRKNSTPTH